MPRKIGFTVVSWSGHEENYSAKELMVHAPTVSGWRSARFCTFPQEITLQMVERCRIRKLQLLAHQYLISAKIEFHTGDRLPEPASPRNSHQLRRLGYVSLSNNEKTGFRARELKSVHVDAVGTYLKLTFHRNHVNQYNIYNQVALVAINILGDSVDCSDISPAPSRDRLIEQYLSSTQHSSALDGSYAGSKYESISPLDDLAFDMYQDPEVAHIIRLLDDKKQDTVRLERYDLAKKLKQAIADLQKVGERLGRYDVEKHSAIEREDYDTAKQKKEQMESYRLRVYQQLELHDLLDMGQLQIQRMAEDVSDCSVPSPRVRPLKHTSSLSQSPKKKRPEQLLVKEDQIIPKPTSPEHTHPTPRSPPPHLPKTDVISYDERPLPALRKRSGEQPQHEHPSSPRSPRATGEPEPLTEKAQREASLPIEIYGDSLVAGAYSKTWSYREDALLAVCKKLTEVAPGTPKAELRNMMRAAVFLCKKALSDKVSSVFQASLKLLRMILSEFVSSHQLSRSEVSYCVEQIWPALLSRTGESTPRLRTLAITFIQEMAVYKEVRALQLVPTELVKPIKSSLPARLALSRIELLEKLLEQLGTKDSGFTLENVMRFLTGVLEHSAASVRELAVRVVQTMYRQHGTVVLHYLPSDDASVRKNVLYKNLFDSFSKIDGRLPDTQMLKGRGVQKEGEREKEEIRSLQEQLAVLKEISEKGKEKNKSPEKPDKPGVKKGTHSISDDAVKASQSTVADYLDNLCIFCGEKDKSFTEEGLDLHYWKHCPMLCRCLQCRQVVEISSLTEHLLTECEHRADFVPCPRCSEAIIRDQLTEHAQSTTCNSLPADGSCNHCPLCHENFPPGEEGWKSHLMDSSAGCTQNTRRTVTLQRTHMHTQGKTISIGLSKRTTVSVVKGKGGSRGSGRIPAPAPRPSRTSHVSPGKTVSHRPGQA
ncbi:LOW QUALITY PROTEIN: centrosomal protein of 104 kDa [Colossoma macropomum]|uniref:LOW QUALITY PROTEIN: centrosomal protein of 104 kDa n=1 Tax=Colossoma macropomum TaxID=42526 RepID=UPI0018640016|nr:LOW QUALITY PROTEIN: centrosomal protein of 104 kDa [Colossoma macropomum]